MLNLLCAEIGHTWELGFEIPFITWLQSLGGKGSFLYYLMNFISMFGEEMVLVGVLGLVYWGLDKRRGEKIGLFMVTATLLNPLVKNIVCRTRPFDAHADKVHNFRDVDGYSFPSGHSSGSASVFLGTALAFNDKPKRKWLWISGAIIPVLVALSRNYLGAHYPTDVVAGLAMGVGVVFLMNWLIKIVPNKYFVYGGVLIVGFAGFFYCTTSDFYTGYGLAIGFTLGLLFEEKVTKFSNTKVWWRVVLRVAVGGALFLALNEGTKGIVGAIYKGYKDDVWFERIFRVLRYAVTVFLLIGVYPLLFAQTEKLWKKWRWLQTDETISGRLPKNKGESGAENENVDNTEKDGEVGDDVQSDPNADETSTATDASEKPTDEMVTTTEAGEPNDERKNEVKQKRKNRSRKNNR